LLSIRDKPLRLKFTVSYYSVKAASSQHYVEYILSSPFSVNSSSTRTKKGSKTKIQTASINFRYLPLSLSFFFLLLLLFLQL
jgi:hypothetical protein